MKREENYRKQGKGVFFLTFMQIIIIMYDYIMILM